MYMRGVNVCAPRGRTARGWRHGAAHVARLYGSLSDADAGLQSNVPELDQSGACALVPRQNSHLRHRSGVLSAPATDR
jgi:hypothetical protein